MTVEHFDVLIVGAGISGIGAAHHLQANCPDKSYAILEARTSMGGTWDLFRYPGVRSDSDMYTLGYAFRPWTGAKAIADGPSILQYVKDTARDEGIERHIRFDHAVVRANWSSADARWTVEATRDGAPVMLTCHFLFMCSGYYNYAAGYTPEFSGSTDFQGRIIHPQHWPDDLDYAGKRVVVIGSGATAVTLVPEMAKRAAHVTMLQRSPTYIVSRPSEDRIANGLRSLLPSKLAYGITRWKNVLMGMFFYNLARKKPAKVKAKMIDLARQALPAGYDVGTHFTPSYNPWDQRVCLVPDSDLFIALGQGKTEIVTDTIAHFTETGIALGSGTSLEADIIVTATGLDLLMLGGAEVSVDGARVDYAQAMSYKAMMFSGVPNLATSFGYTNASWTLKADLTCEYVCRLLKHMDRMGMRQCTPILNDPKVTDEDFLNFTSGYVQRAKGKLPRQGSKLPWKVHQNYARDLVMLKYGKVDDGTMIFSNPAPIARPAEREPVTATVG
ncbi:flavin-containing monooxygenase [Sphingobium boeckii]|uniref:Cation diffusion facilitator CzcD-associated flavoprotein CzcO n=1 Tax=Sphingobium boeckii TaxID=1082345 RepID=A0A7W9AF61_9SPHN|nr:NAD(P)/FAD-dependent oxidoreductase [Sphingobium boeckii]MBB5684417.1 cation diffusion facilitator CzcD-associated flavoprotein CzcO [Sphingobium boeckii]